MLQILMGGKDEEKERMEETRKEGVVVSLPGFSNHPGNICLGVSRRALSKRL